MVEKLDFYFLRQVMRNRGLIINGEVYVCDKNAKDAFVEYQGRTYNLRFQGSIENIFDTELVLRDEEVRAFKRDVTDEAFKRVLGTAYSGDRGLLIFQCLQDVLPYLDEFDSRVNDMPRSELIRLRRKEFLEKAVRSEDIKKSRLSRRRVLKEIRSFMEEVVEPEAGINVERPSVSFLDEDHFYQLKARSYRGDIIFRKNRGKSQVFKRGDRVRGLRKRINKSRNMMILEEAFEEITDEKIRDFIRYVNESVDKVFIEGEEVSHENSGLRVSRYYGGEGVYVYVQPGGFAMQSPFYPEEWYAFEKPPQVGVFLDSGSGKVEVSQIYVVGDFNYLNFKSSVDKPQTFCGPGNYQDKHTKPWQENVINYIMHGVYTLYDGWSRGAHADNVNEFKPISEDEVEKKGLLKTNIHPRGEF